MEEKAESTEKGGEEGKEEKQGFILRLGILNDRTPWEVGKTGRKHVKRGAQRKEDQMGNQRVLVATRKQKAFIQWPSRKGGGPLFRGMWLDEGKSLRPEGERGEGVAQRDGRR